LPALSLMQRKRGVVTADYGAMAGAQRARLAQAGQSTVRTPQAAASSDAGGEAAREASGSDLRGTNVFCMRQSGNIFDSVQNSLRSLLGGRSGGRWAIQLLISFTNFTTMIWSRWGL